jgi:hypothetical protein
MDQILQNSLNQKIEIVRTSFREEALKNRYKPYLHLGGNLLLLMASILLNMFQYKNPKWIDFIPFAVVLILGNFVVYIIHRYPLHGFYKWNMYAYGSHTRRHHIFFQNHAMTFNGKSDWFTIFFPVEIVIFFVLVYHPLFYILLKPLIGHNAATSYLIASSGYFLLYEFVHYCSHLPLNHPLLKIKHLRDMRMHHEIHHCPKLMGKYNFNIVYSLADRVFRTHMSEKKYLELDKNR